MTGSDTTPTAAQLTAHDRRVRGMYADPECVGELLLVGLAFARCVDLADPFPITDATNMKDFYPVIYGRFRLPDDLLMPMDRAWFHHGRSAGLATDLARVAYVVNSDRRRYVPPTWHHVHECGRPRIRDVGLCGRRVSDTALVTDLETGVRHRIGACSSKACKKWLADTVAVNQRDRATRPVPDPPANHGGVLDRHIPEIDWYAVYRHFDPTWMPPPEHQPFHKPKLRLVVCDPAADTAAPADPATPRPDLTVIDGGAAPSRRPALTVLEGGWQPWPTE